MDVFGKPVRRPLRWWVVVLPGLLTACPGAMPDTDPCEPGGHVHRGPSAAEDFCHCGPGWMATEDSLACEPDPDAETGFPFEEAEADACALAANGLTATVAHADPPATVNAFDTVYTLELAPGADGFEGTFAYEAHQTGKALLYLGGALPFAFKEGVLPVISEPGPSPTTCDAFHSVIGVRLTAGVRYTLTLGPTPDPTATLLIRLVP